ncbi:MAG: sugar phosphate isomerase/epimerase family protein [Actinomycetes bacterium]
MTPSFRRDLNVGTTWSLPAWSTGPHGDEQSVLEAAVAAGYRGVQGANPRRCRDLGLVPTTFAIQPEPGGLVEQARRWADLGFVCCTVLLGTGLEDDAAADRLVDEVLTAAAASGVPLYVETHRGTVTQDIWRTLRLVERHPDLRFNADLSHWYTGHELGLHDMATTADLLAPVLDRVRYFHGRIGTSGSIQVDVGDGDPVEHPSVAHFCLLWTRAMAGFVAGAADDPVPPADLQVGFAPELLPAEVGYAQLVPGPDGMPVEAGDRWAQARVLTDLAARCFEAAARP